jgi:hypothetical protein
MDSDIYIAERSCGYISPTFRTVIDNGTYYYPAWRHYERYVEVVCDRCHASGLTACIGFGRLDLCLQCVDQITKSTIYNHCNHCDHCDCRNKIIAL